MHVKINAVSYRHAYNTIKTVISNGQKGYVCLTDVGNVISASTDRLLQTAINCSLLSLADGAPLAYFARLAGYPDIERISGVHLMESMLVEKDPISHYLLGDTDLTIEKVISKINKIDKNITITGHSPPFKDFSAEDNHDMIKKIRIADPDIIWVCFGGGKQEKWMMNNIENLEKGVMIGVGSALRWFTGELKVPPVIFQKLCLQWFYRLISEFIKNPEKGKTFFMERQLRKFPKFLMNFPLELTAARRRLKQ